MNRRSFLRCLPAAPATLATALAAAPAAALQEGLREPADDREELAVCESCDRKLYEGDKVFSYSDGPDFCEAHAPTWNDLKDMQDERIADGEFELDYDSPEDAAEARRTVLAHVEGGEGDKKYVWGL